jgi:YHYH protein
MTNDVTTGSAMHRFPSPCLLRPIARVVLAGTLAASASGAWADDITDIVLTQRAQNCADYVQSSTALSKDVQRDLTFKAALTISITGSTCMIYSNAIPNHDFNATGRFATEVSEQSQNYTITASPKAAARPTPLSLAYDNAVFLNGVKLDQLAAGCFGVGDGFIGCRDIDAPYRYDPLGQVGQFGTDEHNAHTQPDGTYHYHGNPLALFVQDGADAPSPVIGFAADGFPVFGSFISDGGTIRKARSSYQLKSGTRPGGPGGAYDGTFIDDWVYVESSGDLDACNGMTQDGVYGYVVTDTYPHVLGCFTGTPDPSFRKKRP